MRERKEGGTGTEKHSNFRCAQLISCCNRLERNRRGTYTEMNAVSDEPFLFFFFFVWGRPELLELLLDVIKGDTLLCSRSNLRVPVTIRSPD